MKNRELVKKIMENISISSYPERKLGGQSCGAMYSGFKIESDIGVVIIVDHFRSRFKNRNIALSLMELAIEEIITK